MTNRWRHRKRLWQAGAWALVPLAATSGAWAQDPIPASGAAVGMTLPRYGFYNEPKTFKDTFIGRPALFAEPPPGYFLNEHLALMQARADPHRYTLYRTDFLPGTTRLSPTGATRFNLMASRLPRWLGPIIVEWNPEQPDLAEARRLAILATLQKAGLAIIPERVVIGPSPYPGALGTDAANNYNVMITRDQTAPQSFTLTPASNSSLGSSGGGGGGGGP